MTNGWQGPGPKFLGKQLKIALSEGQMAGTVDVFGRLQLASPVLTGWFRGHWIVGADDKQLVRPPAGTRPKVRKGRPGRKIRPRKLNPRARKKLFRIIDLINDVFYGPELERGKSAQAPDGIINKVLSVIPRVYVLRMEQALRRRGFK